MGRFAVACVIFSFLVSGVLCDGDDEPRPQPQPQPRPEPEPQPEEKLPHPLDTILPSEIRIATLLVNERAKQVVKVKDKAFLFCSIALKEVGKKEMLPFFLNGTEPPPGTVPRQIQVHFIHRATNKVFEAVVDITKGIKHATIFDFQRLPFGLQPPAALDEEGEDIPDMVVADAKVINRFAKLGVYNMSIVIGDAWFYIHNEERQYFRGKRIAQVFFYVTNFHGDNHFTHPAPFIAIVDVAKKTVLEIQDLPIQPNEYGNTNRRGEYIPRGQYQYDPDMKDEAFYRPRVKPMQVSQPEGVNFQVDGSLVTWQNWRFRVSFAHREGLILNTIGYYDNSVYRPLFYKIQLSELHLAYGDPRPPFHRKIPFDVGHYGLGVRANNLGLDDCLGETIFFDAIGSMGSGEPKKIPNAICVFEDDAGFLWRKGDPHRTFVNHVRANRLVVMWITTSGNYDYTFMWYFMQDASLRLNVQANGIVNPNVVAQTPGGRWNPKAYDGYKYGTFLAPQLNGMNHQHIFAYRIDANVDGEENSVMEVDLEVFENHNEGERDWGNGWGTVKKLLTTQASARTNCNAEKGRTWLIRSSNGKRHPVTGTVMGYKLVPENTAKMMMSPTSPLRPLVAYGDYDLWVTPYNEDQVFAAGFYCNSSGIPQWVWRDPEASVVEKDIVLWHIFRLSHVPRIEDFSVMPAESIGFTLKPTNFFTNNPAIDIRPVKKSQIFE